MTATAIDGDVFGYMLELQQQKAEASQRFPTPGDLARHIDPPHIDARGKHRGVVNTRALELVDAALVQALATPDSRLIITMPPQEGKSQRVARDFVVWALMDDPDRRIVTGSYAQSLANRNGRAVRNMIATHPELGLSIAPDHGAAGEWGLSGHMGGVVSVGRGAGINGKPADLVIIDDPLKDRPEADSETIRDTCWDWWREAISARLSPGAPVILITTRWHEDDMVGRLTTLDADAGWIVLNIPAQCEDPETDPLQREAGEFMDSARRRTTAQWQQRKSTAGPRAWASLYQGAPSPAAGGYFDKNKWDRYHAPLWILDGPTHLVNGGDELVQSWDLAFKGTKTSDWVVGQVWWRRGADLYLIDQVRGRWGFNETATQIMALSAKWPQTMAKFVEDKANGPAIMEYLSAKIPGLIPVEPEGGKEARAAAVDPFIAARNVHIPADHMNDWVAGFVEEAAAFPNGKHDDQVDAATQAITRLMVTAARRSREYGTGFFDIG